MAVRKPDGSVVPIPLVCEPQILRRATLRSLAAQAKAILSGAVKLAGHLLSAGDPRDRQALAGPFQGLELEAMEKLFAGAPCPAILARVDFPVPEARVGLGAQVRAEVVTHDRNPHARRVQRARRRVLLQRHPLATKVSTHRRHRPDRPRRRMRSAHPDRRPARAEVPHLLSGRGLAVQLPGGAPFLTSPYSRPARYRIRSTITGPDAAPSAQRDRQPPGSWLAITLWPELRIRGRSPAGHGRRCRRGPAGPTSCCPSTAGYRSRGSRRCVRRRW